MAPKERAPRPVKTRARGPRGSSKPWYKAASSTSVYALTGLVAFLAVVYMLLKTPTKPPSVKSKHTSKPVQAVRSWKRTGSGPMRGIVATEFLPKGSLIILDTPFIGIGDMENRTLAGEILLNRINNLSPTAKKDFFNLPYTPEKLADQSSDALAANIFETNAVKAGSTSSVFKNSAYINHSCNPNADFFFRDDLEALVIHAMRDIQKGEEITCPHFDAAVLTSAERQEYMELHRGHKCTCSVCSLTGEEQEKSDARRGQLGAIKQLMQEWSQGIADANDVLTAVEIAYQLLEEENYVADLGWWAGNAVQVCAAHEDKECVTKWAKLAAIHYGTVAGADSPPVKALHIIANDPERSQAWGQRVEIDSQDSLDSEGDETEVEETLMEDSDDEADVEAEPETEKVEESD